VDDSAAAPESTESDKSESVQNEQVLSGGDKNERPS